MAGDNDGLVCAPICDAVNPDIDVSIATGTYGTVEESTMGLTVLVFVVVSPCVGGVCESTDVTSL